MTRIIAIRPEPGLSSTIAAGREMGLDISGAALFEVRPIAWTAPDPAQVDGLLIGSANAIRHGGEQLKLFIDKPVYVVGKTTESAALNAGFSVTDVGTGGLQNVLNQIAPPARLLRVSGAQHVPLTAPDGVTINTQIVYESAALPLDRSVLDAAGERLIVLLHSAVAAQHFASECSRLKVDLKAIELAVFGPRIASSAGKGWRDIHVAKHPNDADLLAMVRTVCQ